MKCSLSPDSSILCCIQALIFFSCITVFVARAWGIATGLTFWSAHIKLVAMLAKKDQQGKFFGILDGGRGLVEAILATIAITLFAYVLSQESGSTSMALRQVIYLYIGVLLVVSPLVYWLLDDFEDDNTKVTNTNFIADLKTILKHREIWLCAICIICGYQLFYATYSFSAYLQQNFGLTAVAVGTITVAKLWMRPIGVADGLLEASYFIQNIPFTLSKGFLLVDHFEYS